MIFMKLMRGIIKALIGQDWEDEFNLHQSGLAFSFGALLLYIPFGFIIASAVVRFNSANVPAPYEIIAQTLIAMALVFPVLAWILSQVFGLREHLQAWLIVRNWTVVMLMAIFAGLASLYLWGMVPFTVVYILGLCLYLATLGVDVRLAGRIGGFNWMGAVFTAILVSITTMVVILNALSHHIG